MSSSTKYIVYKCNVCLRETEIQLDGKRPDPSRCNITLNCRGKLERNGERTAKQFLFTPLVSGLSDFVPRGTKVFPAPQLSVPNPITVFTASGTGILALSVLRRSDSGSNSTYSVLDSLNTSIPVETNPLSFDMPMDTTVRMVLFEISPELLTTLKYTYVIPGPVQIVSGKDDSPDGKNLRFTSDNNVTVFVNGILLTELQYDRSVDNQITFTPTIFETNNVVEVFVYRDLTASISTSKQIVLEFNSLVPSRSESELAFRELSCWGDFGSTIIDGEKRFNLFCTDLTKLNQDKSYGVSHLEVTSNITSTTHVISQEEAFLLLGREPFSFRDKDLYAFLPISNLISDQGVLTYRESEASGLLFLTVDETVITQVFSPIQASNKIEQITSVAQPAAIPGTALEGTDKLTPKYILGPV